MYYINRRGDGYTETVDEEEDLKTAEEYVWEYSLGDPSAEYWVSTRCCNNWKEE